MHILMGVRNGAAHLPAQLQSIAAQRDVRWHLTCADDGSGDGSAVRIAAFGRDWPGRVSLGPGPQAGFAANYLHLIETLPADPGTVALCDQDDLWLPDKLARAQRWLARVPAHLPALYCARRWVWRGGRRVWRGSDPCVSRPGFARALVENIAPGNTIVLNPAATALARQTAPFAKGVFAHDWWLYLLISGAGGTICADPARVLLWRQHGANTLGAGEGVRDYFSRKQAVLRGELQRRIDANIAALLRCAPFLTAATQRTLATFAATRDARPADRIRTLQRLGATRQTRTGQIGLWGAATLGRV